MSISFKKQLEKVANSAMIVDGLNLAFRYKHSGQLDFADSYIATVRSLAQSYKSETVIIAVDKGHSEYRRRISPDYKGNRKEKFESMTKEEKEAFQAFFEEFNRVVEKLSEIFTVFVFENVEADDIAAYIVKNRLNFGFSNIWLISSDRDWDLLVSEGVSRFSYVTRKEYTVENWSEHYPVSPEDYISYKCLVGDSGDNVPGIPGIGPVKATALINQYGSAYDIYDALPIQSKYKYIQALNNNKDTLLKNYELMDLLSFCEEALGESNTQEIDKRLQKIEY